MQLINEELHNLYTSLNIIRAIKSMRMRWAGRVECMREVINTRKILVGETEVKRPLKETHVDTEE
jgi:hypothetical protein